MPSQATQRRCPANVGRSLVVRWGRFGNEPVSFRQSDGSMESISWLENSWPSREIVMFGIWMPALLVYVAVVWAARMAEVFRMASTSGGDGECSWVGGCYFRFGIGRLFDNGLCGYQEAFGR